MDKLRKQAVRNARPHCQSESVPARRAGREFVDAEHAGSRSSQLPCQREMRGSFVTPAELGFVGRALAGPGLSSLRLDALYEYDMQLKRLVDTRVDIAFQLFAHQNGDMLNLEEAIVLRLRDPDNVGWMIAE